MTIDDKLAQVFRIHKFIALAIAGSVLVYALVVEIFRYQGISTNLFSEPVLEKLRFIFLFLSFAMYFIIKYVRQKMLLKQPDTDQARLLGKLALANIVAMGLCEIPAFMGLFLFLGSGNPRDFYPLLVISLVLFFVFFPTYSFWANYCRGAGPASFS